MIRHVIMWKFRDGEEENMQKFLAALKALDGQIPEILHMEIGVNCYAANEHQACLIADFADIAAMERYKNDPRHVAASGLCKAIRLERCAVDYEI